MQEKIRNETTNSKLDGEGWTLSSPASILQQSYHSDSHLEFEHFPRLWILCPEQDLLLPRNRELANTQLRSLLHKGRISIPPRNKKLEETYPKRP
jgi:hypothetical protein